MKRIIILLFACTLIISVSSCKKDFLNVPLQGGSVTSDVLTDSTAVQQLLIGAYHALSFTQGTYWPSAASNWIWGDITSGDAYLGGSGPSGAPHNVIDAALIETYQITAGVTFLFTDDKWLASYDGINRANQVIKAAASSKNMTDAQKKEVTAEARFLRGHFHFEAKKVFNNVPYVDEKVTDFKALTNTTDIWPDIEADFQFAYDNLPEVQPYKGQANKWAAACFLAKAYMFEKKYSDAKTLLTQIISSGANAQGMKYTLMPNFHDNFDVLTENNAEQVFQVQFEEDNTETFGVQADLGESAIAPVIYYGPDLGYGHWKQPSYNLVNSYKTDADGLPFVDGSYNDNNDIGEISADPASAPYTGNVDPRLDWTVGRKDIPYLDYGVNPGTDWVDNVTFGGPYAPSPKFINSYATFPTDFIEYNYLGTSTVNYSFIRYADVLLWAAECEVEVGSLDQAEAYVNMIRDRAKTGSYVQNGGADAANYVINTYPAGTFSANGKDYATDAVRLERRLELALEGHRFFDLVRWGIAAPYLTTYLQTEATRIPHLAQANFTAGKSEYFPIPAVEIAQQPGLVQNPGY